MDVPEEAMEQERSALSSMCYGLTRDASDGRSVLGTMNDFTNALHHYDLNEHTLLELNQRFSEFPCGPKDYKIPRKEALHLLTEALSKPNDSGENQTSHAV